MSKHSFPLSKYFLLKHTSEGSKWQFLEDSTLTFSIAEGNAPELSVSLTKNGKLRILESHSVSLSNAAKIQIYLVEKNQLWFKCFKNTKWSRFQVILSRSELLYSCLLILKRLSLSVEVNNGLKIPSNVLELCSGKHNSFNECQVRQPSSSNTQETVTAEIYPPFYQTPSLPHLNYPHQKQLINFQNNPEITSITEHNRFINSALNLHSGYEGGNLFSKNSQQLLSPIGGQQEQQGMLPHQQSSTFSFQKTSSEENTYKPAPLIFSQNCKSFQLSSLNMGQGESQSNESPWLISQSLSDNNEVVLITDANNTKLSNSKHSISEHIRETNLSATDVSLKSSPISHSAVYKLSSLSDEQLFKIIQAQPKSAIHFFHDIFSKFRETSRLFKKQAHNSQN